MVNTSMILYIGLLSIVVSYGVFYFSCFSKAYQILVLYIGFTLLSELAGRLIIEVELHTDNNPSYHINVFAGLLFQYFIFTHLFSFPKRTLSIIRILAVISMILSLINALFVQPFLTTFPSIGIIYYSIFLVVTCLFGFVEMLKYPISKNILFQSNFWYLSSNFVFMNITFLAFAFLNVYNKNQEFSWLFNVIMYANYLLQIGYLMSLYFNKKESR